MNLELVRCYVLEQDTLSKLLSAGPNHMTGRNIRIHHECEGVIEKSVPRITD